MTTNAVSPIPTMRFDRELIEVAITAELGAIPGYVQRMHPELCGQYGYDRLEREFRRWMLLSAIRRSHRWPMYSPVIREFWHCAMHCTWDYPAFCALLGGYIHHQPRAISAPADVSAELLEFCEVYHDVFNEWPPARIWADTSNENSRCTC